ncbi:hypothetical protein [Actinoallomurus sp. NPDC052274]|uniref:hypothetical protein n=1 Tax=Actinoallomurus sp. NPDC052274 TaxID=3155420 RepID=UPI003414C40D
MTETGYTYTTITGRPGEPMTIGTSFYLDPTTSIRLYGAGDGRPFIGIDHGQVSVNIGPRSTCEITAEDVAVIRRFAQASAELLAEVERLHAERADQSGHAAA